jgi:glycerol-3-phosphate dehydrogenase
MRAMTDTVDILIIGGGVNGAGIACDAAGRGLSVMLCEAGDLAGATSSASSKLIHGGLRYLEHREFRLVREALSEREILLAKAPHIVWPMQFLLPRARGMRPGWTIRLGLFLYDHLYRRRRIPGSRAIAMPVPPLRGEFPRGYAYWDCWVDDARLVVLNALAAAENGAEIRTRTRVLGARRDGAVWRVRVAPADGGAEQEITAGALVNAAGPWVEKVSHVLEGAAPPTGSVRLVKGSHIVVPRIAGTNDALLLQNPDGRVVFVLPYEGQYSLIGTTDIPFKGDPAEVRIDTAEAEYLIAAANRFLGHPVKRRDILWTFSGVRPLYDDKAADPSAVTRDYRLVLDGGSGEAPLLTVYGGKLTTYRRLSEEALRRLRPAFPRMTRAWTGKSRLPGGDMPNGYDAFRDELGARYPGFGPEALDILARRYGTRIGAMLSDAKVPEDLGRHYGGGLSEREVLFLRDTEWARTADDILWRRTKAGLHMTPAEQDTTRKPSNCFCSARRPARASPPVRRGKSRRYPAARASGRSGGSSAVRSPPPSRPARSPHSHGP